VWLFHDSDHQLISSLTVLKSNIVLNSVAQIFKQEFFLELYCFHLYALKYVNHLFLNSLHDYMWFCFKMKQTYKQLFFNTSAF